MVKLNRRLKLLILVVVFATLGWFCLQPPLTINIAGIYMEPPSKHHKFTPTELNDFLTVWYQINQTKYLKKKLERIPLQNADSYPWVIVRWLKLKRWNTQRFFYDEQRLKDILNCVNLKMNLNANIQASKRTNIDLKDLVMHQEESMQACLFDEEEINLVESNREQIISVFID